MENICIKPADNDMKLLVESINILNQFKMLGFANKRGFMGVVQDNMPKYLEYSNGVKLGNFWSGRLKDVDVNQDLEKLLNILKAE